MFYFSVIISLAVGFAAGYALRGRAQPAPPVSNEQANEGREAIQKRIQKRKSRIMERAHTQGRITNDDVEDMFCISDTTASRYLSELAEEGHLTQKGAGRGTYYAPRT